MGLDVYLYHCADLPAVNALKKQYEAETEGFWLKHCGDDATWNALTKDEQDRRYAIYKAENERVAALFGLNADGEHPSNTKIEEDSAKYPDHYFKVGYFRSSYNDGGINNVLRRYGLPDLNHVMGAGEEYEFTPDWLASRARAVELLAQLRAAPHADIDILKVGPNPFSDPGKLPKNTADVRRVVMEVLDAHKDRESSDDGGFGNGHGEWWLGKPLKVLGLVPGFQDSFTKTLYGHAMPCTYVVYRKDDGNEWYERALEIVIETCDFVLAKPDPANYYMHWSS